MSLRTGTELIILTHLLNKTASLYGLLAILTGFHLSPLQFSMYIYSILGLVLTLYLAPHIRKQSPLQCLALAWLYVIDSAVNAAYTVAFGVGWFVVLARHMSELQDGEGVAPGGDTIGDTAGFTNPKFNVSRVAIIETPAAEAIPGRDIAAVVSADTVPAGVNVAPGSIPLSAAVFQGGSIASITVVSALWAIRIYFIFVILAYARGVLRQYIYTTTGASPASNLEDPFAASHPEGQGWKGKVGRLMVRVPRWYWLGTDEEGEWVRGTGGKFRHAGVEETSGLRLQTLEPPGVGERERRRRSGTGPPLPTVALDGVKVVEGQREADVRI